MQRDGNFVLYDGENKAVWDTGTNGNLGSNLILADGCNIMIKSPSGKTIWDSQNSCGKANNSHYTIPAVLPDVGIKSKPKFSIDAQNVSK